MSLMARIRRFEARLEWLDDKGPLRRCEIEFKWLKMKEQVEARLAREPGHEMARHLGSVMGVKLPPLPKPPPPAPVVRPPPPAPPPSPPPSPASVARERSFADVVQRPPRSWPPPPPPVEWETHDIPEHMQIRPVTWRRRGPQDDDDWDDGGRDFGQCLTDYDPLEEDS